MQRSSAFFVQAVQVVVSLFFLTLLGVAVFRPDLVESWIHWIEMITRALGHWNAGIIFLSSFIESFPVIGVLVPGQQIMLVVGGFYGQTHLLIAIIVASIGAMLGNWVGFWLGKRYGKEFLHTYGNVFALGITEQKILAKRIESNGAAFIILWKFHNFTRAFVPFLTGSLLMENAKFWRYNIVGSIIWSVAMLVLWVFFTRYIHEVLGWISWFFLWIIILVGIYIALFRRREFLQYIRDKERELSSR